MLSDVTAFVTGASQGIGREIAITMAEHGAAVALVARSDGIYETKAQIDAPDRTHAVEMDITDEDSVQGAIESVVSEFGGMNCVINNAGIAGPTAPVEMVTVEEWEHTMDVNMTGMFRTVKHAVPHLRESERASIINISSISGKRPLANRTPYTASKMAVIGFTRTLAKELAEDDITVNAICPGATRGPRIESVIEKQAEKLGLSYEEAKHEVFTNDSLLSELTEPEDVAEFVSYLASNHARRITAQDVNVDAGTVWY